jgi:hypothetical protein
VAAGVLLAVGIAVAVLDSPAEERRRRIDARRVGDLGAIAEEIDAYWTEKDALPPDLDALAAWRELDLQLTDPETGLPYRYRTTGPDAYELCATFATVSTSHDQYQYYYRDSSFWHHPAGDHCFQLEAEEAER